MILHNFRILLISAMFSLISLKSTAQIIPYPLGIDVRSGEYALTGEVNIISDPSLQNEASRLAEYLARGFGRKTEVKQAGEGIKLIHEPALLDSMGDEGYTLTVDKTGITIAAPTPAGVFYGIQSLRQLLPPDFENGVLKNGFMLPFMEIRDKPRFPWRAFMLDESRHFMGTAVVKKMLDQMALLKMNVFHWHLTDDQGWRIEIKKYPKLTEFGSWRKDTQLERGSEERTGVPHGGFYTQEQIKEIIAYAQARHITVVPEIEMPGHATAAIAAYPWIGSLGTTTEVSEVFGKLEDSFNISDPRVVGFLLDVLDEVITLFPGEIIHIGGDEVNHTPWLNSEMAKDYMASQGLKSPVDLQIHFTNKISGYLSKAGKRMMGWNDILGDDIHQERDSSAVNAEQKLAPSSVVHFWKGDLGLIEKAVKEGYQVVNSNHWDTYLDYTYQRLPLSRSYAFNPIPLELDGKYHPLILGTGAQIWTEYTPDEQAMQKQVFPRLIAYAEVGWTALGNKDYKRFLEALEVFKERLSFYGVSFQE
ncbi:beta-N-acetylhexosaminidase [Algoriphagus resistens]|uniref:beta-N-acetylhexosaminidase n=1 Tax=Algoriphagus resistens TaxID=1750590 RepID=UPI0009E9E461|nr:beta-N-acetylhexosaminidase [Algoriphagus resistens]